MSSFRLLLTVSLAAVCCWNCSKLPEPPYVSPDLTAQYAYFPLETGKFIEYTIDSIVYDFGPGGATIRDSVRILAREIVTDTLRDNAGQLLYRIERLERKNAAEPWQFAQNIFAARTSTQGIRTENNLRFLKLVFPFDRRSAWNGNLWIDPYREIEIAGERMQPFVNWRYEVDSLDIPAQIGAFAFDSVLAVTEVDETNAIERRLSRVHYAKHIGVVFREQWILDSQYCNQIPPPADCLSKPWTEKAEKGYILRQIITAHN